MTVEIVTARLAAMGALITGVTTSFANIPRVLQDVELPALVVYPGAATYEYGPQGSDTVQETRAYDLTLYIARTAFGTETQGQVAVAPFFDRIRAYFAARPGLELDGAAEPRVRVYNALLTNDSGLQVIEYPAESGDTYFAISARVEVTELHDITYQD